MTSVMPVGQPIHRRVRHTAYGAFVRGLRIAVPEDALCVFDGTAQAAAE